MHKLCDNFAPRLPAQKVNINVIPACSGTRSAQPWCCTPRSLLTFCGKSSVSRRSCGPPRAEACALGLPVAEIFQTYRAAWCQAQLADPNLSQRKIMSAGEQCRLPGWTAICCAATPVSKSRLPTIHAATSVARSAKPVPRDLAPKSIRPNCCRWPTVM
jgi:hypothetical protein